MPKPDLLPARIKSDGSLYKDAGKGFQRVFLQQELGSTTLPMNISGSVFMISDIPQAEVVEIRLNLLTIAGTSGAVTYTMRFNGDSAANYSSGTPFNLPSRYLNLDDKIVIGTAVLPATYSPTTSDTICLRGKISIHNPQDFMKVGNGLITVGRRNNFGGAVPTFAWLNSDTYIHRVDIGVEDSSGNLISNHEFLEGTSVQILRGEF